MSPRVSKSRYERLLPKLRNELLDAQARLREDGSFALALILTGVPAAGRSETVNELLEWLDPKHISVHALRAPDREDRQRPPLWRYWRTLPARGRMAFYFGGWYSEYLALALHRPGKARRLSERLFERIRSLETMLAADGVRVVKLHLHTDAKTQRKRLARLSADPLTRWRATREDRWLAKHHKQVARASARVVKATDQAAAPWHVIDGTDEEHRLLTVGRVLRDELRKTLRQASAKKKARSPRRSSNRRATLPLTAPATAQTDEEYEIALANLQGRLASLTRRTRFGRHALVLAFEGLDAAGKGGAIRRITHALDARQYQVIPVGAPTAEESSYPYLWRFWRYVPELGSITIYDRSWYGRVLVERVRGLTPEADWRRAFAEIREFELELTEHGVALAKFWLDVSKEEQLERFRAREADSLRRFKVDKEDWANRRCYDAYRSAAAEMIKRTDAESARWTLIAADDKKMARLAVLKTVCEAVERALDR
jgi:polyphosphate:AMP phosphotransferase